MLSIVIASLCIVSQRQETLEPVTFSVSGFSCVSCARSVQMKLEQATDLRNVVVTLGDHRARMRIDRSRKTLQSIASMISGSSGKFIPRLLLKLEERKTFPKAKEVLEGVAGIRYVREPNDQGLMLIDLRPNATTTLDEIYSAAKQAGIKIADAPTSK